MISIAFCIIVLSACVVKCDVATGMYTDINDQTIEEGRIQDICAKNTCITKCCPRDYFIAYKDHTRCIPKKIIKLFKIDIDYTAVDVYTIDSGLRTVVKTNKNISESPYYIIHNTMFNDTNNYQLVDQLDFYLTEDGSIANFVPNRYTRYIIIKPLDFCVDIWVNLEKQKGELVYKLLYMDEATIQDDNEIQENIMKYIFTAITMLISCFFLLLTLLVYLLLPYLRNIGGKILMALISTLATAYMFKAVINLGVIGNIFDPIKCQFVATVFYFAILSSFFWMNVMSFNLFWTLRGTRKCREIHRRGENFKFMMYSLYASGIPLVMTVAATIIDNVEVGPDVVKPFFDSCQDKKEELALYMFIPMGILIFTNTILFGLTTYNIWLTKSAVKQDKESRNTSTNDNKFGLYLRLSIVMGVGWVLEAIQFAVDVPFWLYIILNAYNVLIGVAIFFLFVYKKKTLFMLCARFDIKWSFVENMRRTQSSKTETSRCPGSTKSNISQRNMSLGSANKPMTMSTVSETCIE